MDNWQFEKVMEVLIVVHQELLEMNKKLSSLGDEDDDEEMEDETEIENEGKRKVAFKKKE